LPNRKAELEREIARLLVSLWELDYAAPALTFPPTSRGEDGMEQTENPAALRAEKIFLNTEVST